VGPHERGGTDERPQVSRLINRLRPAPLESLGSLLERLRVANHYPERRWLTGVLGRHLERPEVLRRAREFQILEALTGLERATLVGLTLHRFAPWYGVDRRRGRPLPVEVAYLSAPLWPDIGTQGHTREEAAVCPACWGERAVILVPWWLHQVTACPWHGGLLREGCAGCDAPLRLTAGQAGCGQCGAAIGAMETRSLMGDADGRELSALVWWATGCGEGTYPPEELTLGAEPVLRRLGTPALLRDLWGGAQAAVAAAARRAGVSHHTTRADVTRTAAGNAPVGAPIRAGWPRSSRLRRAFRGYCERGQESQGGREEVLVRMRAATVALPAQRCVTPYTGAHRQSLSAVCKNGRYRSGPANCMV